MKSSKNSSGKKPSMPETDNPNLRTVDEVLAEIREIINNTHWVQTRLAKLESNGYYIEECWVKNGSIETIWYMKQKKVLRIQVAESEQYGDFQKAKCVIIPASDIQFLKGDESRVRNLSKLQESNSVMSNPEKIIVKYKSNSDTSIPEKMTVKYKQQNYGTK